MGQEKLSEISVLLLVDLKDDDLSYCMDSIDGQTDDSFELIVLVNGSSEGIQKEMNQYKAAKEKRVTILELNSEADFRERIQVGMQAAQGAYLMITDSLSLFEYEAIRKFHDCVVQEEADLVTCQYKYYVNQRLAAVRGKKSVVDFKHDYLLKGELGLFHFLIKKSVCQEIMNDQKIWDPFSLSCQLVRYCKNFSCIPEVLIHRKCRKEDLGMKLFGIYRLLEDKPEKELSVRLAMELLKCCEQEWLELDRILPVIRDLSPYLLENELWESYPSSGRKIMQYETLCEQGIPHRIFLGALDNTLDIQRKKRLAETAFRQGCEVILLDSIHMLESVPQWVEEAYEAKKYDLVECYLAVECIVRYGGFYMSQSVVLNHVMDGVACFDAVFGCSGYTSVTIDYFGGTKENEIFCKMLAILRRDHCFWKEKNGIEQLMKSILMIEASAKLNGSQEHLESKILVLSPEHCMVHIDDFKVNREESGLCVMDYSRHAGECGYTVIKTETLNQLYGNQEIMRKLEYQKAENIRLRNRWNSLLNSHSMRVTSPIRAGMRFVYKLIEVGKRIIS